MTMTDGIAPKAPRPVRGRPFEKGRSGNPLGRRVGCRNKTAIAAAALLASEAEALTRKAVERALVGDPTALRLCIERILPQCAPTGQSPWAEGPRHRQRHDHWRGGHDSGEVGDA
jgi:Family of unknown function (DUF5681)